MRLRELYLIETTDEDRAIVSLGVSIYQYLQKYEPDNEPVKVGELGNIVDLTTSPLKCLSDVTLELLPEEMMYDELNSGGSNYTNYSGSPVGFWDNIENVIKINKDKVNAKNLSSTISHELRHALDDIKSEGRASQSDRYFTPKNKDIGHPDDPYTAHLSYLAQPAEINARFVQVMKGVSIAIKTAHNKGMDAEQTKKFVMQKLKEFLQRYHFSDVFPEKTESKDYKRILKRAMDFIEKETAHIKSASF